MEEKPIMRYFTGNDADQFTFYRIPKLLFTNKYFSGISTDAKVLYGLMLDRIGLSIKNGWMDDQNRAFIFFSVEDTMELLNCKKNKAIQTLAELDSSSGVGLIEKKRQGQGKPTRIYVKNFFIPSDSSVEGGSEVGKTNFKRLEKTTSKSVENKLLEVGKITPNNNESIKNDFNNNKSILISSSEAETKRSEVLYEMNLYSQLIKDNIEYDLLMERYPFERDIIDELYNLILEIVISKKSEIVIAQDRYPLEFVKSRFLQLDYGHIEYVLSCLKDNTTKIRNIKKYMLAVLFNSLTTVGNYYQQAVNCDMQNPVAL
ncbi:MAG: replication initiator protein A [Butyrivibrio sp.]|nr:replication initiator protein A [Butyrivibrio sp.]